MTETFRYLRRGEDIPSGWELVADFGDCHHGVYPLGIIKLIESEPNPCPFGCGELDYKTHDVHGHYETTCCKQITSTCCPGADQGETG